MSPEQLKYLLGQADELLKTIINQLHRLPPDAAQTTRQTLGFLQTLLAMCREMPAIDEALRERCAVQHRRIELLLDVLQSGQPAYRGMGRTAAPLQICDEDLYNAWLDSGLPAAEIELVDCDEIVVDKAHATSEPPVDTRQTRAVYEMLGRMNRVSSFFTPQEIEKLKENPRRYALAVEMNLID